MFLNDEYFDNKRNVPISLQTRILIGLVGMGPIFQIFFLIIVAVVGSLIIAANTKDFIIWFFWSIILLLILVAILFKRNSRIERYKERNLEDYVLAQKILAFRDNFLANPPNLAKVSDQRAITEDGWRPIRVDYHLDQVLKAEIAGTISGSWFGLIMGSFEGEFKGSMSGRATPELFNESTFILLQKGNQTLRIISPSVKTCKEISYQFFNELLNYYGKNSHSGYAIQAIGWGKGILWKKGSQIPTTKLIDSWEVNPSHIHDRLTASLSLPFEERPVVRIRGAPIKEGVMLGYTIALGQEPDKVLFPIEFVWELSRRLAPILGIELSAENTTKLLSQ